MRGVIAPVALGLALIPLAARPSLVAASGVSLQLQGAAEPVVLTTADVERLADVPATPYRLRERPGRAARVVRRAGTRLATVLRAAGVDPAAVPTLEITRDDGSILYLPRHRIDPSSGPPPLLYASGRSVGFIRNSTAPGDVNAADSFQSSSGTPIRITVSPASVLEVTAHAEPDETRPGRRVRFTADVGGALPDERLSFEWRFGDGRTADTRAATHRFARRGRYEVVLRVTGNQSSGGTSEPLAVQVGAPEPRVDEAPEGAGRARAEDAPPSGPVSGSGSSGAAGGAGSAGAAPSDTPATGDRTKRRRTGRRRSADRTPGRVVSGAVLGAREARPAPATPTPDAARAGGDVRGLALGAVAGAAACLALLALGAATEWRRLAEGRGRTLGVGGGWRNR
jgi:PKD domain